MSEVSEVTITFRVPRDLKDGFAKIAKNNHRNSSLLLRDFMRETVESGGRNVAPLTDAQQLERARAVAYGQASAALEGFPVSPEAADLGKRFVSGQIELSEFAAASHGAGRGR
ncbi:antitoxin VbhA family protein [Mesorhizobium sp. J428]|uniref:antitoxin VbhA family protein n=1 Tax=Mesorhizobium sp. J428 TaxID=2898440 RepID=UPI0021509ADE|nr:antitoxin VbhA family protein [Mesorhizobium sp. J428]MCR5860145.1 antitoxin VbhA family protein [Mesorhizobium sp. J428]MCR5860173.1 antitoxin VbhA family protein [Mesorhizobium sp. J428]MCR5860182.1 antitoxin VbhA family protein [Mesorhizobium sp. J428]MCR5860211.1 antitoxin VbhA family protein [Mesorhizobium sp. J428]